MARLRRALAEPDADDVDDAALLRAAAAGEPLAVRRLLDDIAPTVYGFVHARVGGNEAAAEDILQETLLEAVRAAAGFRGEAALTTWICAIARRRLARYYETERRAEIARSALTLVADVHAPDHWAGAEQRDEVVRALGRLSPLHRQVLVLKYLDGLEVAEIAGHLGRTHVQVQSLLQRARDGLRRELGDLDG